MHEVARTTDLLAESVVQPALTDAMVDESDHGIGSAVGADRRRSAHHGRRSRQAVDPAGAGALLGRKALDRQEVCARRRCRAGADGPADAGGHHRFIPAGERASSHPSASCSRCTGRCGRRAENPFCSRRITRITSSTTAASDLWRGFSGIMLSSLAAVLLILLPLLWMFYRRARSVQAQREAMMRRAVDASTEERRRIAATLHDGVVQQLAGAAFALAGEARAGWSSGRRRARRPPRRCVCDCSRFRGGDALAAGGHLSAEPSRRRPAGGVERSRDDGQRFGCAHRGRRRSRGGCGARRRCAAGSLPRRAGEPAQCAQACSGVGDPAAAQSRRACGATGRESTTARASIRRWPKTLQRKDIWACN